MTSAGALPDEAFERLAAAEELSFWFRARNRLLAWALDTYFPSATSFLEVGCGNGYVLAGLASSRPDLRLTGCDLSEAGLRHARRRVPAAELICADAAQLPYRGEFDAAGAFDVIEHVTDDHHVLVALRSAVKVGGGVLVTVPQHRWLWSDVDRFSGHQRRYRRPELIAKLAAAGLQVRRVTSFVSLLLPLMAASRLRNAVSNRPLDPSRELLVAPRMDRLLERAMAAEAAVIARGADLPAGGSLLAIAERT